MTLIVTAITEKRIIQVSDRRLTLPNGSLFDDESNKALVVYCKNARFLMSYTGYSKTRGLSSGLPTIPWASKCLSEMGCFNLVYTEVISQFRECVRREFGGLKSPTAFVIAGYEYMNSHSRCHSRSFSAACVSHDFPYAEIINEPNKVIVQAFGMISAITDEMKTSLSKRIGKNILRKGNGKYATQELVSFVRKASKTLGTGYAVGENCMSAVISFDPKVGVSTFHYPKNLSGRITTPLLIMGNFPPMTLEVDPGGKIGPIELR